MTIRPHAFAAAALLLVACAGGPRTSPRGAAAGGAAATPDDTPLPLTPAGVTRNENVKAAVLPYGPVPYDGFSLPLPSPDGRLIATQTGIAPDWPAVLGESGALATDLTRVDVYALEPGAPAPVRRVGVDAPVMLGRSSTPGGFLVEQVKPDSSRRIGLADWTGGRVRWIVDDGAINAFGALGPGGRLAWCRRAADDPDGAFALQVRRDDGSVFAVPADDASWLLPTWSGRGDGLFALRLRGDRLDLVHGTASSPETWRRSLRTLALADHGSVHLAYQAMNGQPSILGAAAPAIEQVVFFHPGAGQAAVWRPRAVAGAEVRMLGTGTLSGAVESGDGFALAATASELRRCALDAEPSARGLLRGLLIPRPVERDGWPWLLLSPGEDRVGLTGMRLVE